MAGTNAFAAKAALFDLLKASPALAGVQVCRFWPGGTVERECVFGGRTVWTTTPLTFRPANGRLPREEAITLDLHIRVMKPGAAPDEVEARAVVLGTVVEELLAADPLLGGAPGVALATIDGGDLDHGVEDESSVALLTYRVGFKSMLDAG